MAPHRTALYSSWRACERFKLIPPGVQNNWDDNTAWIQTLLLAYDQIRTIEETEEKAAFAGVKLA